MDHPAGLEAGRAAEELRAVLAPGEGMREELDAYSADALDRALELLISAQDRLTNGERDLMVIAEAIGEIREASDAIESTRGLVRWMPHEVVLARADALRILDGVTGRW
jgi:hypothetical protein